MIERDLESRLRSAYRSRAGRADPGALSERVHSIPATVEPERRRWWHGFGFGASHSAGSGGVEVKGASNMLTATRIAAIFAALALGATFLAVQVGVPPDTAQQPAAPTGETSAAVSRKATGFTGTSTWGLQYEEGREVAGEGKVSMLGAAWQMTLSDMSDPRMNGKLRIAYNEDFYGVQGRVSSFTTRIDNELGSWLGTGEEYFGTTSMDLLFGQAFYRGTGAYEGLSAMVFMQGRGVDGLDYYGIVFPGEMPEVPEMPEPPAE